MGHNERRLNHHNPNVQKYGFSGGECLGALMLLVSLRVAQVALVAMGNHLAAPHGKFPEWVPERTVWERGSRIGNSREWLREGAKGLLYPGSKGLPRVSCTFQNLFCTGVILFCTSARGFSLSGSKRPFAPSRNHFPGISYFRPPLPGGLVCKPSVAIFLRLRLRFSDAGVPKSAVFFGPQKCRPPPEKPCDFLRRKVTCDCDSFCDFSRKKASPLRFDW